MTHDAPVVIVEKNAGVGSFLFGVFLGAGLALLLAPQSGEETREVLKTKGRRLRDVATAKADEWGERVEEGYEKAKERVEKGFESARRNVEEKRDSAHDALKAGKAAVHSARDELDRRLSEARTTRRKPRARDDTSA